MDPNEANGAVANIAKKLGISIADLAEVDKMDANGDNNIGIGKTNLGKADRA